MKSMRLNPGRAAAVFAVLFAMGGLLADTLQAQLTIGRSQFRRTVDPSERSVRGSLVLRKDGAVQTVEFTLNGLATESLASYFALEPNPPFVDLNFQNFFVYSVSPLDRTGIKRGNWFTRLSGVGGSPPLIPFISDLDQASTNHFLVGHVTQNNVIQITTNIVGNITNIVIGIPVPLQDRTNIVSVSMWAPSPALTTNPAALSYSRSALLSRPAIPPAPNATGKVRYKFNGATGRSVFEVRAAGLPQGQIPHLFIADSTNLAAHVLIDAGTMTTSRSGRTARFIRDTQFGDPLPQQLRDAGDLSGRVLQILDLNGNPPFVYLEGVIP